MTSALSWLGVGAAVCWGVGASVQFIETVLVVAPSCAVTTNVVVPGMACCSRYDSACICICLSLLQLLELLLFLLAIPPNSSLFNAPKSAMLLPSTVKALKEDVCALGCRCFPEVEVVEVHGSISCGFELEDPV